MRSSIASREIRLISRPASPELHDDAPARQRLIEAGRARSMRFTPPDYVEGVFGFLDRFEAVRRCWA